MPVSTANPLPLKTKIIVTKFQCTRRQTDIGTGPSGRCGTRHASTVACYVQRSTQLRAVIAASTAKTSSDLCIIARMNTLDWNTFDASWPPLLPTRCRRAARSLGTEHATVSRRVDALEAAGPAAVRPLCTRLVTDGSRQRPAASCAACGAGDSRLAASGKWRRLGA